MQTDAWNQQLIEQARVERAWTGHILARFSIAICSTPKHDEYLLTEIAIYDDAWNCSRQSKPCHTSNCR